MVWVGFPALAADAGGAGATVMSVGNIGERDGGKGLDEFRGFDPPGGMADAIGGDGGQRMKAVATNSRLSRWTSAADCGSPTGGILTLFKGRS